MLRCLPNSTLAFGDLAEAAGPLGIMMESSNQSQSNPGAQVDETPCIFDFHLYASIVDPVENDPMSNLNFDARGLLLN